MTGFRALLLVLLLAVVIYTLPVIANHGLNLFAVFFGDIGTMAWPGQFNMDFLGFLTLSAVWMAWRNQFTGAGLGPAVLAFFGGIPVLTTYLLVESSRVNGHVGELLLGRERFQTLSQLT
ncbi:MAG: hypothetical protein AAF648_04900 [Pseudomonadota bacterium]